MAKTEEKTEAKKAGPWKVRTPNRGLDRFHTPFRLRFSNGEVTTEDANAANHCGLRLRSDRPGHRQDPQPSASVTR